VQILLISLYHFYNLFQFFIPAMALERCFNEIRNLAETTSEIQQWVRSTTMSLQSTKSPDYEQLMRIETRLVTLSRTTEEATTTISYRLESLAASLTTMETKMDVLGSDPADQRDWWMFSVLLLILWLALIVVAMMTLHFVNFRYHHLTVSKNVIIVYYFTFYSISIFLFHFLSFYHIS
jgi:hypothetical protein